MPTHKPTQTLFIVFALAISVVSQTVWAQEDSTNSPESTSSNDTGTETTTETSTETKEGTDSNETTPMIHTEGIHAKDLPVPTDTVIDIDNANKTVENPAPDASENPTAEEPEPVKPKKDWKATETDTGLILRPQLSAVALSAQDMTKMGYQIGGHVGWHKNTNLKFLHVGTYHRSRLMVAPILGTVQGWETRLGSVMGAKLTVVEMEAGLDAIQHRVGIPEKNVYFANSYGVAVPVKVLINSSLVKVKVGVEPRWYLVGDRPVVEDWKTHNRSSLFGIPFMGNEFLWTAGVRTGIFGLSYDTLYMEGGTLRTLSIGLQR